MVKASEKRSALQRKHQQWLEAVAERKGRSISKLATDAGLADTTLSRIFRPGYVGTLSGDTIARLTEFYGVPGPDEAIGSGFGEAEATPYIADVGDPLAAAITAFVAGHDNYVPWRLNTRALELAGYLPGDVVILDIGSAEPGEGVPVCAQIYDFEQGSAETVWRIHRDGILIGASTDPRLMRPLDQRSASIKGVVRASFRRPLAA